MIFYMKNVIATSYKKYDVVGGDYMFKKLVLLLLTLSFLFVSGCSLKGVKQEGKGHYETYKLAKFRMELGDFSDVVGILNIKE